MLFNPALHAHRYNACLLPIYKTFDCVNSVGQAGGGGRDSCVVCTNADPCLFDVMNDPAEKINLAKDPQLGEVLQTMKAKLATFATPYVPKALTSANLEVRWCRHSFTVPTVVRSRPLRCK